MAKKRMKYAKDSHLPPGSGGGPATSSKQLVQGAGEDEQRSKGKRWALRTPVEGSLPVSIGELISRILQVRRWGLCDLSEEPTTHWGTQKQPSQLENLSKENEAETATTGSALHRQTCKK